MAIKQKNRHFLKNLSVKWSLFLYMSLCVIAALLLSVLLGSLFNNLQNDITNHYAALYEEELSRQGDIVVDDEVVQKDAIRFYTQSLESKFTPSDLRLYKLYGAISSFIVLLVFPFCIVLTSALFYHRKLKQPLAVLDASSAKIAEGNLDFQISYDSGNEFGRLAGSFETMRQTLYQTNREMWETMEQRKQLNAAFAHDLRTPLTVLKGYCDFLLKFLPDGKLGTDKTVSTLIMMQQYIGRLEGYTKTMTSLQKLEELVPSPQVVVFDTLCDALSTAALTLAGEKQLILHRHGSGSIALDSALVFQVCENLVANAARCAAGRVDITCRLSAGVLTITVTDDGPGFTAEALKRATEPYFRETKDKEQCGTAHFGIGLSICKLLCRAHGGTLKLANAGGGQVTASFAALSMK